MKRLLIVVGMMASVGCGGSKVEIGGHYETRCGNYATIERFYGDGEIFGSDIYDKTGTKVDYDVHNPEGRAFRNPCNDLITKL